MVLPEELKSAEDSLYRESAIMESPFAWRLVPMYVTDASWQMAYDHAILLKMVEGMKKKEMIYPTVRSYKFASDSVVLGKSQKPAKIDLDIARKSGVKITTRLTGGGAAYFTQQEYHVSVIAPLQLFPENKSQKPEKFLPKRYYFVNYPISKVLQKYGIDARAKRTSIRVPSDRRLFVSGQAWSSDVIIHHGTLHVNFDYEFWKKLLKATPDEAKQIDAGKIVRLCDLIPNYRFVLQDLQVDIANALVRTLSKGNYESANLSQEEKTLAEELHEKIYGNFDYIQENATLDLGICQTEEFDWFKKNTRAKNLKG